MRKKRKNTPIKIGLVFITILFLLVSTSISYSLWYEELFIQGEIQTGQWTEEKSAWARMYDDPYDLTYPFARDSWATYLIHQPTEIQETFYLYAGQIYRVGELYVWKDSDYLYIEYSLDEEYNMSFTHLHVCTDFYQFPLNPSGNPKVGNFMYIRSYGPEVSNDVFQIDWNPDWDDIDLFIAAHANVWGYWE